MPGSEARAGQARQWRGPRPEAAASLLGAAGRLAALAAAAFLSVACSFNYGSAAQASAEAAPSAVFRDFDHQVFIKGQLALGLHADLAESYEAEGRILLHGVTFTEYDRSTGEADAEGMADEAVFFTANENAEFSGSIEIQSRSEDAALRAEHLSWDGGTKVLSGGLDRSVTVTKGNGTWLRGAGFSADSRRRSFGFREAVEGSLVVEEEAPAPGETPATEAAAREAAP
jgi:LPS export ABC transporter protein LptC